MKLKTLNGLPLPDAYGRDGAGIGGSCDENATNIVVTGGTIYANCQNENSDRWMGSGIGSGEDGGTSTVFSVFHKKEFVKF